MLRQIEELGEVDKIVASFAAEPDRVRELCEVYWRPRTTLDPGAEPDPFAAEAVQLARSRLAEITGRAVYDPAQSEAAPYLAVTEDGPVVPNEYQSNSAWLGEMVQAHGGVLKALAMEPGQRIIEFGPGDGQIALHLARMKCDVTVVDIEPRYLARIRSQAAALQVHIETIEGPFGVAEAGRTYDRVLFYEAFHHALDHHALVLRLRDLLAPGGAVVLAGEPIMGHDHYYRPSLPYAWGPRLDGLSLRAMRTYGWCELGFAREYLIELFMRAGFLVSFRPDAGTDRAAAYIATLRPDTLNLAGPIQLEAWGMPDCWYAGEGNVRWSRRPAAAIPVDRAARWSRLALDIANPFPVEKPVSVQFGSYHDSFVLTPGASRTIALPASAAGSGIVLNCPVHKPRDFFPLSTDDRTLGLAVSELRYEP